MHEIQALHFAVGIASSLWDFESWYVIAERNVTLTRAAGALGTLPVALENSPKRRSPRASSLRRQ